MRTPTFASALLVAAGAAKLAWAQNLQDDAVQLAVDGGDLEDGQVASLESVPSNP